jgi:hypothetical protein
LSRIFTSVLVFLGARMVIRFIDGWMERRRRGRMVSHCESRQTFPRTQTEIRVEKQVFPAN